MDKKIKFYIIDNDENSSLIIENYLQELSCDCSINKLISLKEVSICDEDSLNIFIIDVSENTEDMIFQIDEFEQKYKNCKFILSSNHVLKTDYIIRFLRKTKKDFIEKPIAKNYFLNIVNEIVSKLTSEQDFTGQGKLISVFSNKGGLGKTTLAVNLACELGNLNKQDKIAIVDMNMFLGDVTTFLDVNPPYDMKFIADKINEQSNIIDLTSRYGESNVFIISDSPYREYSSDISKESVVKLFNALRKNFKYIIVDSSSAITDKTKYIFDFSDLILLVSEANLPTLRNCKKCLDFFENINVYNKTELILNRFSYDDDCSSDDVENVLRKNIFKSIPNDWQTVTDSINKGLSISECYPNTAVSEAFVELAGLVTDKLCR